MDILTLGLIGAGIYFATKRNGPEIAPDREPEISGDSGYYPTDTGSPIVSAYEYSQNAIESYKESGSTQIVETRTGQGQTEIIIPPETPKAVIEAVIAHNETKGNYANPITAIPAVNSPADLEKPEVAEIYNLSTEAAESAVTKFFDPVAVMDRYNEAIERTNIAAVDYFTRYAGIPPKQYPRVLEMRIEGPGGLGLLGYWKMLFEGATWDSVGSQTGQYILDVVLPEAIERAVKWETKAKS